MKKLFSIVFLGVIIFTSDLSAEVSRLRCTWRDDPSSTMNIIWDQVSGYNPVLYYGTQDFGTYKDAYSNQSKPTRVNEYRGMKNNIVRLTGLLPDTKYYFFIQDSYGTSKRYWFKTISADSNTRLSVVAGGDSRNNRSGRIDGNVMVQKLRPDFVMFGGDMTADDNSTQWMQWMDDWQRTIADDGRINPIVAARGNHERSNEVIVKLFDVPSAVVQYGLSFADDLLRVYTLNSMMAAAGDQSTWLKSDLQKNKDVRWKVAHYHHPMRPHTARKSDRDKQRDSWAPLFRDYGVRLAVECDAHVVKSTYPIVPSYGEGSHQGFIQDNRRGTIYVGEGTWGAPLRRNDDNKKWTRASGSFNQVKWMWIDRNNVEVRSVKTHNSRTISSVSDLNKFIPPFDIDIWSPPTGDVITLHHHDTDNTYVPASASYNRALLIKDFEPSISACGISVKWETTSEPNDIVFQVQRAIGGEDFKTISTIHGEGTANKVQKYHYRDKNVSSNYSGEVKYRLRCVKSNGKVGYYGEKSIFHFPWSDFQPLYSSGESILLDYEILESSYVSLCVCDQDKNYVLYPKQEYKEKGEHSFSFDIDNLSTNQYVFSILINGKLYNRWFYKN